MEIILTESHDEAAPLVTATILARLKEKPNLVLGLPTGSTRSESRLLAEAHRRGEADFSWVRTFNLDEYFDLPADHPRSYRLFMKQHLFDHGNIPPQRIHFPPSEGKDLRRFVTEAVSGATRNRHSIQVLLTASPRPEPEAPWGPWRR